MGLYSGYAQVGINILVPDSSAVLQLESTNKGLALPRLTTMQMNAIFQPLKGLTIFNTSDSLVEYYNGQCWLRAYEKNCYYCDFKMTIDHPADTLDRIVEDSVFATVTVSHIHGTQPINTSWSAVPPSGVQIYQQGGSTIDTSGSFKIVVKADVFSTGGNIPITISAYCDNEVRLITYIVYVKPCVLVDIATDQTNYNVQSSNSTVLPAGAKVCVLLTVFGGITVHSNDPVLTALDIGNLNPMSLVGIINNGAVLGRGGDGGGVTTTTVGGNPGQDGGTALNLTTRTIIRNFGEIYGGGGGGSSAGLSYSTPSIPIIGSISLGFGAGGGGGSENGQGGPTPGGIALGYYAAGASATAGVTSIQGAGGVENVPINIPIGPASITITPQIYGGTGGAFATAGGQGSFAVNLKVCVSIPIIGTICPININIPFSGSPAGGQRGLAVKRNGNSLQGLPDAFYYSYQVKGQVSP